MNDSEFGEMAECPENVFYNLANLMRLNSFFTLNREKGTLSI